MKVRLVNLRMCHDFMIVLHSFSYCYLIMINYRSELLSSGGVAKPYSEKKGPSVITRVKFATPSA